MRSECGVLMYTLTEYYRMFGRNNINKSELMISKSACRRLASQLYVAMGFSKVDTP